MRKNVQKLKVMTVLGTRPEIIRLSRILPKLDKYTNHAVVYTNQNYDYELSKIFFDELGIRKPNYLLSTKSKTLAGQISKILEQVEGVILKEKPDAFLVLGDTNSTLSSIIARRLKIMIFHMEAGNRCFDKKVPEETNRKIVDHISDINLPYTEHARRYLILEGIHPGTIYVTGSPLAEVLDYYKDEINKSSILTKLKILPNKYFLASIQREENVDTKSNLATLINSLNRVGELYKLPVIVSLHPRTKRRIKEFKIKPSPFLKFRRPFGFFDYNKLQKESLCVLSDSGSIQEESSILGFRAIQVRTSSERPEAFDTGSIILTGFDPSSIINAIELLMDLNKKNEATVVPKDYQDKNVSTKVVKLIMGLASINKYHNGNLVNLKKEVE